MIDKGGYVYILTNSTRTVLYTGVTKDICSRIWQHYYEAPETSFVSRYKVRNLIYFEMHQTIQEAIAREKQIKSWTRKKKDRLINAHNPSRKFLSFFPDDGGLPEILYPDYDETLDREL